MEKLWSSEFNTSYTRGLFKAPSSTLTLQFMNWHTGALKKILHFHKVRSLTRDVLKTTVKNLCSRGFENQTFYLYCGPTLRKTLRSPDRNPVCLSAPFLTNSGASDESTIIHFILYNSRGDNPTTYFPGTSHPSHYGIPRDERLLNHKS